MLTVIVIPVQLLLVVVAMVGFNQEWHVEEERPLDSGPDTGPRSDDEWVERRGRVHGPAATHPARRPNPPDRLEQLQRRLEQRRARPCGRR